MLSFAEKMANPEEYLPFAAYSAGSNRCPFCQLPEGGGRFGELLRLLWEADKAWEESREHHPLRPPG
jgi:hypothetical protein